MDCVSFFSLCDLRYLVVLLFFFLHPPHTLCTVEPSCKKAVGSCSGLHQEGSRRPDPSESNDLPRSTCLIFLPASAVGKHLLHVSTGRRFRFGIFTQTKRTFLVLFFCTGDATSQ